MTLCVAWKFQGDVWLASDSRLSVGGPKGPFSDLSIKICSIPIEIVNVVDREDGPPHIVFKDYYGMAFTGNLMSAYLLREMLTTVLTKLQSIPQPVTFDAIVKVILAFYEHYLKELFKVFNVAGEYQFFLAGRCPSANDIKIYKFTHSPTVKAVEVLLNHPFDYDCIGSGENHFRDVISADLKQKTGNLSKKIFSGLRKVIDDPTAPDVGGLIQTGNFDNGTFKLYGILNYDLTGDQPRSIMAVGGLPLDNVYKMKNPWDLHIRPSLKTPFQDDLDSL